MNECGIPEVSVIIPVYNVESYLRECLDSVLNQTYKNIEVICVDDESTDCSADVVREYASRDSRVTLILSKHKNAGAARNIGYRASRGKYLLFLDADDVFSLTMVETLRNALIANDADIATCDKRDFMSGSALPELAKGNVENFRILDNSKKKINCFREFVGWSWDKLFKREMAEKYGLSFQEQQAHNDFFFCNCMCCLADKIVQTKDVFIAHRKHEMSIAVNRDKSPLCFSSALRVFYEKMDGLGFWKKYPEQLRFYNNYVVELGFWTIDTLKRAESISLAYSELRRILSEQNALDKDKYYMNIYPQWFARYKCLCKNEDVLLFWRDAALEERKAVKWIRKQYEVAIGERARQGRSEDGNPSVLEERIRLLETELQSIKRSFAYRVGMFLTWPLRKLFR